MSETTAAKPEQKAHFDSYAFVSEKVIAKLEQGVVPWQQLWDEAGPPRNLITKSQYTGINAILLGMEQYEQNWFLSYDEVNGIGGKVKKGTKGHSVIRWVKNDHAQDGKDGFYMKTYTVFNIAQCEKIPDRYLEGTNEKPVSKTCEFVISSMPNPPKLERTASHASYELVEDVISLPKGGKKDMLFYSNYFRQLVHSTGHDSRLARKGVAEMSELADRPLNSCEDLVADIGLCFLLSSIGVHTVFKNSPEYIGGWIEKLKEDKKLAVVAANRAQKACDYILRKEQQGSAD